MRARESHGISLSSTNWEVQTSLPTPMVSFKRKIKQREQHVTIRKLTHLERLEAESIHIMREVVAESQKPVMLYSVGKDSAVMLHLARKAFYPSPPPFPLPPPDPPPKFQALYPLRP